MRRFTIAAMAALCAVAIFSQTAFSQALADEALGPLSQRPDALEFAVNSACVPWLRDGGKEMGGVLETYTGRSGVRADIDGRPAVRLHGFGHVQVAADSQGCIILSRDGDGRAQRRDMLKILERSYLLETLDGPNAALLHGGPWTGLRETYCFRLDERVAEVEITTSHGQNETDPQHPPALRMRLFWNEADAVRKGVCRA